MEDVGELEAEDGASRSAALEKGVSEAWNPFKSKFLINKKKP